MIDPVPESEITDPSVARVVSHETRAKFVRTVYGIYFEGERLSCFSLLGTDGLTAVPGEALQPEDHSRLKIGDEVTTIYGLLKTSHGEHMLTTRMVRSETLKENRRE